MIILFTDFGWEGPYVGQLKAVAAQQVASCPVIDMVHDLPKYNTKAASYFIAAIMQQLPMDCIVVAVVDPGVGSTRKGLALRADHRWFVGPDNGLLNVVAKQAGSCRYYEILYEPTKVSFTFHGRDVFMPVALKLFQEAPYEAFIRPIQSPDLNKIESDLAEVIYIDGFGNLMSGLRASVFNNISELFIEGRSVKRANTFSDVSPGEPFFYTNSQGLIEIAVNCGNAKELFAVDIGSPISI